MEREARRKKISSQGTDRMALITGRIQTLDPNLSKSSSFSDPIQHHLPAQHARSTSEPVAEKDIPLFQDYSHDEVSRRNASLVPTRASDFSDGPNLREKPIEYHLGSITPKEINFSIISSENTRALCSFAIAVLVVLSHVNNLPHNVVKSKSLIAYRPLYAVLLTDALIVAARIALYSQGKEENEEESKFEDDYGKQNWDGAVKLLEWGLVLHQILRAVFIDCSFYLSIVICGLCFV
ncbi:hypothetical protein ABFS83_09G097700 [Erythranthe nasuta]